MPRILQGQEKEIIESALAESRGKVAGADGAAREARHSSFDAGFEDQAARNQERQFQDGCLTRTEAGFDGLLSAIPDA
jgi:hypothetical protein